ncbi:alpha/beta hydrolase [Promineifilum sp.]|uniref:alpha/beta hydrolase n=1 Tax=Promineifilum sp. TaxID=2664178 RepID=UPI0035B16D7A
MTALAQIALFVLFVHVIFRPLMSAYLFIRPPRLHVTFRSPEAWGAPFHDVVFTGGGGVELSGWYVPSRNGAAVVLVHGHGGNRLAVSYHAETLVRAGYGVLMFDLRAHGQSEGRRFERGQAAVEDVLAAVALVARQPDVHGRVGVMGISIGGMLALQAAARHAYVRAVAVDGPGLATVDDLPPPEGWLDLLWRYPLERYYQAAIDRLSRGPRPPATPLAANVVALRRVARRPILFISAGQGMEQRLVRHFHAAAGEPKQLWELPRAGHAAGWVAAPEAYGQTMVNFFNRALSVDESRETLPDRDMLPAHAVDEAGVPAAEAPPTPTAEPGPVGERTISAPAAMMIAFATIPVTMMALFIPFQWRWGLATPRLPAGRPVLALLGIFALLMGGLLLRQGVHWLAYRVLGRVPARSLRLGMNRAAITPQVRCELPVPARAYRVILLLPALLLGVAPGIVAIAIGSWLLVIWALWMLVAASGDLVALWAMRGVPPMATVRAHPTRAGCEIISWTDIVQNIDN